MIWVFVILWMVQANDECPSGQYLNSSTNQCVGCPAGYSAEDAYASWSADSNSSAQSTNSSAECFACSVGKFQNNTGATECFACSVGKFRNNTGATECVACSGGKFQDTTGATECKNCTYGWSGTAVGQHSCTQCPTGWATDGQHNCTQCPAGSAELFGNCTRCSVGKFQNNTGATECKTCPNGWVGPAAGQHNCTECPAGWAELFGSCTPCEPGQYSDAPRRTSCIQCPAGFEQPNSSSTVCTGCAVGQYSNNDNRNCGLCPSGFGTDVVKSTNCTKCGTGRRRANNGTCVQCEFGKFLLEINCATCPRGYQHTADRTSCDICQIGRYSNNGSPCRNCSDPNMTNIRNGTGSWKCCTVGQSCSDCAAGKYRSGEECKDCPQGYVAQAASDSCIKCAVTNGYYQDMNGQKDCKLCSEGQEAIFDRQCRNCPAGFAENGFFACEACPRGWYSNETAGANKVCQACSTGKTTESNKAESAEACTVSCTGQIVNTFGACQLCSAGKAQDGNVCTDCAPGFYSAEPGKDCTQCPNGYSTSQEGQVNCFACQPGKCRCLWGQYLSPDGCQPCPAGYYSAGDDICTACAKAHYQDEVGQHSCKSCPPGNYSDEVRSTACKACTSGRFQPNSASEKCHDCPKGRFSDAGQEECTMCPEGRSTEALESANVDSCTICPAGYIESERVCIACAEGLYQNERGAVVCKSCPDDKWSSPGSANASECFELGNLVTYTFGNLADSKPETSFTTSCELRANFVMLCPACTCDADSRNGFWAGPVCNECARGFATRYCTSICPGYDGIHDSTICNGNGRCWFGLLGNGLCYCGGKNVLDSSAENVFVDVQYCPAGQICPGYGVEKRSETAYVPNYYLLNYRQYSAFVLQMTEYTPARGHMWFKRYSQSKGFENTCTQCTRQYSDSVVTSVGYWNPEKEYVLFPTNAQSKTGFHGENCQHECAVCLNGGECVHSPHTFTYSYTIKDTFRAQKSANLPTTTCLCTSNVYDASNMCCPNGFQPYIYDGKRGTKPYSRYTNVPHVTMVDDDDSRGYYVDRDIYLEPGLKIPYKQPEGGNFTTTQGRTFVAQEFSAVGPYNKHVYHGTSREICRACPGLFGKGVRAVTDLIETETQAEDYWWNFPASAGVKKCNGNQGVCDFYRYESELDVDFMGSVHDWALVHRARLCEDSIGGRVGQINTLEECVAYGLAQDASFVGWAPDYYRGGVDLNMTKQADNTVLHYDSADMAKNIALAGAKPAWAKKMTTNEFTIVADALPIPDADSEYQIYHTLQKRCLAFRTCDNLIEHPTIRAFNVYWIERGRGDERLDSATFNRFDTCFTYTKNYDHVENADGSKSDTDIDDAKTSQRQTFGLYLTQSYAQGKDPFLGGQCPKGYFCSQNSQGIGFKEACPVGYYQPRQGQTRSDHDVQCSRIDYSNSNCQPNLATKNISDYVDKVCLRCPRTSFSSVGAMACTECPPGRVKKISGQFDPGALNVFNIPTAFTDGVTWKWFYIANEQGAVGTDCALTPSSMIHVPTANFKMFESDKDDQFLPVISCPFGFSSQPGTYIVEDIWGLDNILKIDRDVMKAPYIYIDGSATIEVLDKPCACSDPSGGNTYYVPVSREQCEMAASGLDEEQGWNINGVTDGLWHGCIKSPHSSYLQYKYDPTHVYNYPNNVKYICERLERAEKLIEEVTGAYCYPCPGDGMTGPGSGICSTCTGNLIRRNMKLSLHKLVVNSEARMYYCDADGHAHHQVASTTPNPMSLPFNTLPKKCNIITRNSTDRQNDIAHTKNIQAWYYLQKPGRVWKATHVFGVIQDSTMQGASIELTVSDCILACSTVFNTSYNSSGYVKPTRVGYALAVDKRHHCLCNEGNDTIQQDWRVVDSTCSNQGSNNECISPGEVVVTWYESTVADDWSKTNFPLCGACGAGKYFESSIAGTCAECPEGRFTSNRESVSACFSCPAGFFQNTTGNAGCRQCRSGFYNGVETQSVCKACPVGYHQNEDMQINCKECAAGYYQNNTGRGQCVECQLGRSRNTADNATSCKECTKGTFASVRGKTACEQCSRGHYQEETGKESCKECAAGHYQEKTGKESCEACFAGQHQDETGQQSCKTCLSYTCVMKVFTLGNNVRREVLRYSGTDTDCPYPPNATSSTEWPLGNWWNRELQRSLDLATTAIWNDGTLCSNGDRQFCNTLMPTSQFQDERGQTHCKTCPAGHACKSISARPVLCDEGTAMPAGVHSEHCFICPTGRFSSNRVVCTACPVGWAATEPKSTSCSECQSGLFNDETGQPTCRGCTAGQFEVARTGCTQCPTGWHNREIEKDTCRRCPRGYFSNEAGRADCKECAAGQYQDDYNQESCKNCRRGKFQDETGSSGCSGCPRGTYQNGNNRRRCTICPRGYKNYHHSMACYKCPPGQYGNSRGECTCCPNGYDATNSGRTSCRPCGAFTGTCGKTCQQACKPCL